MAIVETNLHHLFKLHTFGSSVELQTSLEQNCNSACMLHTSNQLNLILFLVARHESLHSRSIHWLGKCKPVSDVSACTAEPFGCASQPYISSRAIGICYPIRSNNTMSNLKYVRIIELCRVRLLFCSPVECALYGEWRLGPLLTLAVPNGEGKFFALVISPEHLGCCSVCLDLTLVCKLYSG